MKVSVEKLIEISDQQFLESSLMNLFCTVKNQVNFNKRTIEMLQLLNGQSIKLTNEDRNILLMNLENGFITTCYQTDPYINFGGEEKLIIQQIYKLLMCDISYQLPITKIEDQHYERIRLFIKKTNPNVYQINHNSNSMAKHFICAEYSPEFQLNLLGIDAPSLIEPILDIGCGEHGQLVEYFRRENLMAYGIDRLQTNKNYFYNCNWLEFDYGYQRWGTIVSNLSFSSHFLHHFLQNDGIDIPYAKTYMTILESLVKGGSWIYAPSVPFIEDLLPKEEYDIKRVLIYSNIYKTQIDKL